MTVNNLGTIFHHAVYANDESVSFMSELRPKTGDHEIPRRRQNMLVQKQAGL